MSTIIDVTGQTVEIPSQPKRIVSCTPYLADAVALFDAIPYVAGVSDEAQAIFPETRPSIGPGRRPDMAKIRGLQPDLVLADVDAMDPDSLRRLATLTSAVFRTRASTVDTAITLVCHLGQMLGKTRVAVKAVKSLEQARDVAVQQTYGKPGPRVLCITWIDAMIHCVPSGTYTDHIIRVAGGVNIAPTIQALQPCTIPQIRHLDPNVILLPSYPYRFTQENLDWIYDRIPCKATMDGRVHIVPGKDLFFPGPRTGRAIQQLLNIFHTKP